MKRTIVLFVVVLLTASLALAEEAKEIPKQEMQMYHIVLAEHGPNWKSQGTEGGMDVRMQVINGIKKGAKDGLIVSAGLVNDETDVEFIIIFNVETKGEAYKIVHSSPNVKNGFFSPMIYSYFAPKGLEFQK